MIRRMVRSLAMASVFLMLVGCSAQPLSRMDQYFGSPGSGGEGTTLASVTGPVTAGLFVVYDAGAAQTAPVLSEKGMSFLRDQVRARIESGTAIRISRVLSAQGGMPSNGREGLAQLARQEGLSHLLVALFSSAESEVPAYLPLTGDPEQGGTRPNIPGYEAVNYALAELALLDATTGQIVARSDGRAWARLNRLNVPIQSNAYPVIHRSLRVAPIYPPEAQAKDILRSIAGDEALEQAVGRLRDAIGHS